ncbi:MAG: metal-dependent hydrolase [Anaerolineales bacterium]|nr:metal-dependent hydrolase [Pseudomonadota bacterium]MCK4790310.1 metal-dependent hydrolase [Desulfobacteraceae bacterium]MCK4962598.1 metal-dependent hydrolase [Anaerolineales bacterium]
MIKAKVVWLGHASASVEFNDKIIYFDPWLDDNPACSIKRSDVKKATAICTTHGHIDHLGDSFELARRTGAKLICTPELGFYADSKGLKEGQEAYALNTGGSWWSDGFTITMVPASHTSEIMGEGWIEGPIQPGSGAIGFILDIDEGATIYFSGDTGVSAEMPIIRDLYRPNVAIMTVGGKYNMGYREAAYAASLIWPEYLIPTHYGTFDDQQLDLDQLEAEMKIRAPGVKLVRLKPGESFEC